MRANILVLFRCEDVGFTSHRPKHHDDERNGTNVSATTLTPVGVTKRVHGKWIKNSESSTGVKVLTAGSYHGVRDYGSDCEHAVQSKHHKKMQLICRDCVRFFYESNATNVLSSCTPDGSQIIVRNGHQVNLHNRNGRPMTSSTVGWWRETRGMVGQDVGTSLEQLHAWVEKVFSITVDDGRNSLSTPADTRVLSLRERNYASETIFKLQVNYDRTTHQILNYNQTNLIVRQ